MTFGSLNDVVLEHLTENVQKKKKNKKKNKKKARSTGDGAVTLSSLAATWSQ